jgi:hypothetical protein
METDFLNNAELYDLLTDSWTTTGKLTYGRDWHTESVLADERVLVSGGTNIYYQLSSVEIYEPARSSWTNRGKMRPARSNDNQPY